MSATRDTARTRTMLLARARGRQDALEEEFGERPERPPRPADRDLAAYPAPTDVGTFGAQAFLWRLDVAVIDPDGSILLEPDGDGWRLPGGDGERGETIADAAERHVSRAVRADVELRDLLWTQLLTVDYGDVELPALRVVVRADAAERDGAGEWFALDDLPDGFEDADALAEYL